MGMFTENEIGDDIDLERELIDYESDSRFTKEPESPPKKQTPFERTSQSIAQSMDDIAAGRNHGTYPAIESILHHRQYIDIPRLRERVAVVEHRAEYITNDITDLRQLVGRYASQEELREVDKRVDNVHARIDRDVLPAIHELRNSAVLKLTVTVVVLLLSLGANTIGIYRYFIK